MLTVKRTALMLSLAMLGLALMAGAVQAATAASRGQAAVAAAAKGNKYLFIFFWKDDTQQSRTMRGVFQTAMAKMSDKADSIEIQTNDPAEGKLVAHYGVDRAPLPFALAIAPNGAITKGCPTRFDEKQLRDGLVSPGTAECMKALQDRKLVLLCVEPASAKAKQVSLQKGVQDFTADEQYVKNSKAVTLNAGDPAEASFLKDLCVDAKTNVPVTVLLAPPGSVVGTFAGEVTKEQLVAKVKESQSGCCGPGCKCHQH